MEGLDSVMFNSSTCCYTQTIKLSRTSKNSCSSHSQICFRGENQIPSFRKFVLKSGNCGFDDKGHMEYYSRVSPVCGEKKGKGKKGWNGIPTKKRVKLLKGLVEDLSTFSDLGFGLELECDNNDSFVADDKARVISQAAETLLSQLKQLRAEEEEQMKCKSQDCESSSDSSDSECDEVIDMNCVKNKTTIVQPMDITHSPCNEQPMKEQLSHSSEQKCCNMILDMALSKETGIEVLDSKSQQLEAGSIGKKIEVCMGGKCKKLGGPALMEEFQRVMGDKGVVEGCKCMGKCKSAPNVRAVNGDDSLNAPSKSLCIGVGLEDVELIVANYFAK
ncbi:Diacylglycerol O-acyltransferase 3 cytosolic [Bienertia sinuspersici]